MLITIVGRAKGTTCVSKPLEVQAFQPEHLAGALNELCVHASAFVVLVRFSALLFLSGPTMNRVGSGLRIV